MPVVSITFNPSLDSDIVSEVNSVSPQGLWWVDKEGTKEAEYMR